LRVGPKEERVKTLCLRLLIDCVWTPTLSLLILALANFGVASVIATAQASDGTFAKRTPLKPKSATPAVLDALLHHEVVGINSGHDDKDIDDFILALTRDPSFPKRVNDIAVQCGTRCIKIYLTAILLGSTFRTRKSPRSSATPSLERLNG
jgi:hypothetical protein